MYEGDDGDVTITLLRNDDDDCALVRVYSCLIHTFTCVHLPVFQIDDQRHIVLATTNQLTLLKKRSVGDGTFKVVRDLFETCCLSLDLWVIGLSDSSRIHKYLIRHQRY